MPDSPDVITLVAQAADERVARLARRTRNLGICITVLALIALGTAVLSITTASSVHDIRVEVHNYVHHTRRLKSRPKRSKTRPKPASTRPRQRRAAARSVAPVPTPAATTRRPTASATPPRTPRVVHPPSRPATTPTPVPAPVTHQPPPATGPLAPIVSTVRGVVCKLPLPTCP